MKRSKAEIEALIVKARQDAPSPSVDLLARVLMDAEANQPRATARLGVWRPGLWGRVLEGVGGWPSLGGLIAATIIGFGIGINPSAMIDTPASAMLGSFDTLSQYDADLSGLSWELSEG
ncbi:MAG: hypothetical protein ABJI96_20020 [Paracoccaceae bacterium]